MSGRRRGRVAALAASAGVVAALLLVLAGHAPTAAQGVDCTLLPDDPECTTTTSDTVIETTTTFVETTTTTFLETTTTFGQAPTTAEVVQTTTSTSLDVSTSQNVLVPGDGTEGAESTTTTETPTTIASDSASDGPLLAVIVVAMLLLAVAVGVLTWRYWVATRPPLSATVGSDHG